jgi:peptide/nickel transport system ATP-binding protein
MSNGTTLTATMLQVSQVATRTGWFARALAAEPDLLICDEILSSLDTVVAASVLALLQRLKVRLDISFLFISHDLSTVAGMADRIFVLYSGTLVEEGWPEQVFLAPNHPYTAMLLACVPQLRQGWLEEVSLAAAGPGGPATEEACVFSGALSAAP